MQHVSICSLPPSQFYFSSLFIPPSLSLSLFTTYLAFIRVPPPIVVIPVGGSHEVECQTARRKTHVDKDFTNVESLFQECNCKLFRVNETYVKLFFSDFRPENAGTYNCVVAVQPETAFARCRFEVTLPCKEINIFWHKGNHSVLTLFAPMLYLKSIHVHIYIHATTFLFFS